MFRIIWNNDRPCRKHVENGRNTWRELDHQVCFIVLLPDISVWQIWCNLSTAQCKNLYMVWFEFLRETPRNICIVSIWINSAEVLLHQIVGCHKFQSLSLSCYNAVIRIYIFTFLACLVVIILPILIFYY